ncbi:hypothetical protein A2774_04645 [Candidatus Roizmanbacteria bacterium RIFCSPHIGHO2_01_FULL_39_12c]|uniref:Uncharacterized protein n=1 Tax=Candidatus Roizmanbacteria bacterium RIFCSPHIGHO2_01_FULL_39_12c TaxID=1802031 RepID=A0A1F7GBV9_9BACT|nr:MAG: hypothetical protein A2774_04645 [Candidatus Roizmanbacteria bacterium RIFCSPHIGHO2_01_FULL_39_12c]OGK47870.1 MAG: hypothetical protein A2963_03390 [Candidatus Roizmanbacteria bacterium RIFCSPLOWO2_01_FULL_40_13]
MVFAQFEINETTFPAARIATFANLLNVVIPILITGAAILLLIMLLYGAFLWITSSGNQENLAKAQKTMTYAILGLVVVILSFIIVKVITLIFKIDAPL